MADKAKRTVLSAAERVAKLEADLAAAKAKANAQQTKAANKLLDRRQSLVNRIAKLEDQINDIDKELKALGFESVVVEPTISTDVDQFTEGTFV